MKHRPEELYFENSKEQPFPTFRSQNPSQNPILNSKLQAQSQDKVCRQQIQLRQVSPNVLNQRSFTENGQKISSISKGMAFSSVLGASNALSILSDSQQNGIRKFMTLFDSRENVAKHIYESLCLRRHSQESAKTISEIVAASFEEFYGLSHMINSLVNKRENDRFYEELGRMKRQLGDLKLENAQLFQKINEKDDECHRMKQNIKIITKKSKQSEKNALSSLRIFVQLFSQSIASKLSKFQTSVMQRLNYFQQKMLKISIDRNNFFIKSKQYLSNSRHSIKMSNISQNKEAKQTIFSSNQKEITTLRQQMHDLMQQLQQQKQLYDQILDKNIQLEKALYLKSVVKTPKYIEKQSMSLQLAVKCNDIQELSCEGTIFFHKSQCDSI